MPSPFSRNILVVEDNPDHRDVIALALRRRGYGVHIAASAAEALEAIHRERFALVISHYGLPDQSGARMLQEARAAGSLADTPGLIMSGQTDLEQADGFAVLKKPFDMDTLVQQVVAILGHLPSAERRAQGGRLDLVLYYTPPWPSSVKARRNLETLLAGYGEDEVRLTLCDIGEHPDEAEADGIVFAPTLVRKAGGSPAWIVGDLTDAAAVVDLLRAAGLEPKPSVPPVERRKPQA